MRVVPVEYVWCSGADTHHDLRSKLRTVTFADGDTLDASSVLEALPLWNFDGSSTKQATGEDTEIVIKPVAVWPHPFLQGPPPAAAAFVALCECFYPDGTPTIDNSRFKARGVFEHEKAADQHPWFGLEQEYVIFRDGRPLGWPEHGEPTTPQGPYYCATGPLHAWGRKYVMAHYSACIKMGLKLSGLNAEVMPAQWEYQVGPCEGIEAGDHAVLARWVYLRLLEDEVDSNLDICFDSKPVMTGNWNGSGMHTNFSTKAMREPGGLTAINSAIDRLRVDPYREIALYGGDNDKRLSGKHESSRLDLFNCGVGTRHTSCRIPNQVAMDRAGYFEDRRPSASADPWLVTARLFATACDIPAPHLEEHAQRFSPLWLKKYRRDSASPQTSTTLHES